MKSEKLIYNFYKQNEVIKEIAETNKVAIAGFGLTSMDILTTLTLGRGGKFIPSDNGLLEYMLSGKEPIIYLYSKSGLPYRSRPNLNEDERYTPAFFTIENIENLKNQTMKLNLEDQIMPLLYKEMTLRYYTVHERMNKGNNATKKLTKKLIYSFQNNHFDKEIQNLANQYGTFEPERVLFDNPMELTGSPTDYEKAICEFVLQDIKESEKGIKYSPLKASLELLRSLRNTIRYAVEFSSLEPDSHKVFLSEIVPTIDRNVTGPQKERMKELLALIKAGVVKIPFGPNPKVVFNKNTESYEIFDSYDDHTEEVGFLFYGFISKPSLENADSVLVSNLFNSGRLTAYYNEEIYIGGVNINDELHPINISGIPEKTIWLFGPLSEGAKYYNHYIPSPNSMSPSIIDADNAILKLIGGN